MTVFVDPVDGVPFTDVVVRGRHDHPGGDRRYQRHGRHARERVGRGDSSVAIWDRVLTAGELAVLPARFDT